MSTFARVLEKYWFSSFEVKSGTNESFGLVTIEELYHALKKIMIDSKDPLTPLEKWVVKTQFLMTIPPEFLIIVNEKDFGGLLFSYNKAISSFLESHEEFYLWYQPNESGN